MPDTGSPWNIPYVENADLVRDWPADSLLVANAVAAGLTAAGNAGIGSNVVQTVKTDTFATTSDSYATITGLTATITPTSDTAKILVMLDLSVAGITNGVFTVQLLRGASTIYAGAASGSRSVGLFGINTAAQGSSEGNWRYCGVFLDSPGVATAVTYSLEAKRVLNSAGTPTFVLNRSSSDGDDAANTRSASSITAIEVAA